MEASKTFWEHWHGQVKQVCVALHAHQQKTLAVGVLGIIVSGSAVWQRSAESLSQRRDTQPTACQPLPHVRHGMRRVLKRHACCDAL